MSNPLDVILDLDDPLNKAMLNFFQSGLLMGIGLSVIFMGILTKSYISGLITSLILIVSSGYVFYRGLRNASLRYVEELFDTGKSD